MSKLLGGLRHYLGTRVLATGLGVLGLGSTTTELVADGALAGGDIAALICEALVIITYIITETIRKMRAPETTSLDLEKIKELKAMMAQLKDLKPSE